MQKEFYETALAEYKQRRAEAARKARALREKSYSDCPELETLEQERKLALYEALPANPAHQDAKARLAKLDARKAELLASLGLDADAFSPKFTCPKCADTGFVPPLHTPCPCLEQRCLELALQSSNLSRTAQSFESFNENLFSDEPDGAQPSARKKMRHARMICEDYANSFPNTRCQNLVFIGGTGVGKTFLLNSIAKRVMERGYDALLITAYNFTSSVLASIKRDGVVDLGSFLRAELLVIDDLGSEPMINNITTQYLFSLLNERASKHTLIATNLPPTALKERYDERVFSRIFTESAELIHFSGKDVRVNL